MTDNSDGHGGHNVTDPAVDNAPADRPATDAGATKVRGFADRVRLGVQIEKARQVRTDVLALETELSQFVERLRKVAAGLSSVIAGLEAERDGRAREPARPNPLPQD